MDAMNIVREAIDGFVDSASNCQGRRWCGVEHEFVVRNNDGPIDFRSRVNRLDVGTRGLDPGDPCAHRLGSGAVLTADGSEAEVATSPVDVAPGFTYRLVDHARSARGELVGTLGSGEFLEGYSTHINIEVPDRWVIGTARRFLRSFALPMMLLMDNPDSPGLLVRPRRGRLELGGDYVEGDQLRAASVFAAAATTALSPGRTPRSIRTSPLLEPALERYGWYVDRRAYGPDLYSTGRATRIGRRTAQEHLHDAWEWVRPTAAAITAPQELMLVDQVIEGSQPLPCESHTRAPRRITTPDPSTAPIPGFGSVLRERQVGGCVLRVRHLTWDFIIFDLVLDEKTIHLSVPGRSLDAFLASLDSGVLDSTMPRLFDNAEQYPVLSSDSQTNQLGVFSRIGDPSALIAKERDTLTGRVGGPGAPNNRTDKHEQQTPIDPPAKSLSWPSATVLTIIAAIILIALIAAIVLHKNRDTTDVAAGPPTTTFAIPGNDNLVPGTTGTGVGQNTSLPDPCSLISVDRVRSAIDELLERGEFTIENGEINKTADDLLSTTDNAQSTNHGTGVTTELNTVGPTDVLCGYRGDLGDDRGQPAQLGWKLFLWVNRKGAEGSKWANGPCPQPEGSFPDVISGCSDDLIFTIAVYEIYTPPDILEAVLRPLLNEAISATGGTPAPNPQDGPTTTQPEPTTTQNGPPTSPPTVSSNPPVSEGVPEPDDVPTTWRTDGRVSI